MMKKKILFGVFGLVVILLLWIGYLFRNGLQRPDTHHYVSREAFGHLYQPDELKVDLEGMIRTCEIVHPDLYYYTPKPKIQKFLAEIERQLNRPMTRMQFYPYVARLAAAFGDGHTYANLPIEEWKAYTENNGVLFPFEVIHKDDGLRIKTVWPDSARLQPGDRLLSVNGFSADSLLQSFVAEMSGPANFRLALATKIYKILLWVHWIHSPYQLVFVSQKTGQRDSTTVPGLGFKEIQKKQQTRAANDKSLDYEYRELANNMAYINFRHMRNPGKFDQFLQTTFRRIREHRCRGLIVDLRENGGGDSKLGNALLSYITDKPYRFSARVEWKVSAPLKQYLKGFIPSAIRWLPLYRFSATGRKIWNTPEGEMAVWESPPRAPEANPLRYTGPVCFLIGPNTFSSAMLLANGVADYHLATLIGEETGGRPNGFGEVYLFDLKNTRLQVSVSSKRFVRANGDTSDRRGVLPDFTVHQTQADLENGVDTVLQFAQNWILQQGPSHEEKIEKYP